MQYSTFFHFQVVVLCTNLFLICNSNKIPFKEVFFLEKLLHSIIEVEKKVLLIWLLMFGGQCIGKEKLRSQGVLPTSLKCSNEIIETLQYF